MEVDPQLATWDGAGWVALWLFWRVLLIILILIPLAVDLETSYCIVCN